MKKIRLIISSLFTLTLSLGAAVTGTVAWFTAQRKATVTNSSITSVNVQGDLTVEIGTEGQNGIIKATNDAQNNKYEIVHSDLTNGSVDVFNENIFAVAPDDIQSDGTSTSFIQVDANQSIASAHYATMFTAKYSVSKFSETQYLYFDLANSTSASDGLGASASKEIKKALRIGIKVSNTSTAALTSSNNKGWLVYSPFNENLPHRKYVDSINTTALVGENNVPKKVSPTLTIDSTCCELGMFDAANEFVLLHIYTWFEGEDPYCVNDQLTNETFNVDMKFKLSRTAPTIL